MPKYTEVFPTTGITEKIRVDTLHHRYLPKITPLWLYPGEDPMHIANSHHVSLLKCIKKHGLNWRRLKKHPYFQERRHRYNIGMYKWDDSHVKKHITHRWETFKSLERKGWRSKKAKESPILVLDKPLMESRYNWDSGFLKGPECYDGFGRLSAAYILGWEYIYCIKVVDAKPGTCNFDKAFNKIKRKK